MRKFECPNYTGVPNELLGYPLGEDWHAGIMADLSEAELRVLLVVLRATLGYHKRKARISVRRVAKLAGLSLTAVMDGALALENRGLLIRIVDEGVTEWAVNIAWERMIWKCPVCQATYDEDEMPPIRHHIIPRKYGGNDKASNLQTLCANCHKEIHAHIREHIRNGREPAISLFQEALASVSPRLTGCSTGANGVLAPVERDLRKKKKEKENKDGAQRQYIEDGFSEAVEH